MQPSSSREPLDRPRSSVRSVVVAGALVVLAAVTAPGPSPAAAAGDRWLTSVDQAVRAAADGDRYILVDLYAEWCGWCKVLEEKVFSTPEFERFTKDWVLLRVDVDDGGEGSELQSRFKAYSLPTTLILDARMIRIGMLEGFLPTASFLSQVSYEIKAYQALLGYYERARHSDDPETLRQLARELHERGDGARAAEAYRALVPLLRPGTKAQAWAYYLLADAHRIAKELDRAREALSRARQVEAGEDPKLIEELDLLSFHIAQDAGDCDAALAKLETFLRKHPQSAQRRQVERALKALRRGDGTVCA